MVFLEEENLRLENRKVPEALALDFGTGLKSVSATDMREIFCKCQLAQENLFSFCSVVLLNLLLISRHFNVYGFSKVKQS